MPVKRHRSAAGAANRSSVSKATLQLPAEFDAAWVRSFQERLLAWFESDGRDLPWRGTRDPYRILVSETMLQQTTTQAVRGFYERFLETFPTVENLAAAPIEAVLKAWEGLGYYRRARSLHAAAGQIVDRHGGVFPTELDQILALPGVGRYTAGALGSFAFGQRWPIVEANTARLYARLLACRIPLQSSGATRLFWLLAEKIVEADRPDAINHALMDLGSAICTVRSPNCLICPVRDLCIARRIGAQEEIPPATPRRAPKQILEYVVLIADAQSRWWVQRRPPGTWWEGLWDFPRFHVPAHSDETLAETMAQAAGLIDGDIRAPTLLTHTTYGVTTHRITAAVVTAQAAPPHLIRESTHSPMSEDVSRSLRHAIRQTNREVDAGWADWETLQHLAMTSNARKLCQRLKADTD